MQAQLLVGPIAPINGSDAFSSLFRAGLLTSTCCSRKSRSVVASTTAINGEQNHYAVLGVAYSATSADIKKAYRLLARKYHPDVSKDSQAGEVFKTIRQAYEVLSNEVSRRNYDCTLKSQNDICRLDRGNWSYSPEFDNSIRIYKWAELRRKMQNERYWKHYNNHEKNSSLHDETTDEEVEEHLDQERGSFTEVLRSTFISLFLLEIFGSRLSLTFSSLTAIFDKKLDSGYKMGYVIAWVLGGRSGILLTLCLSFASWVCGKTSSSIVVLVVIAMWIGSNLARYAPLPPGALLALLYMSIKLQVDLG